MVAFLKLSAQASTFWWLTWRKIFLGVWWQMKWCKCFFSFLFFCDVLFFFSPLGFTCKKSNRITEGLCFLFDLSWEGISKELRQIFFKSFLETCTLGKSLLLSSVVARNFYHGQTSIICVKTEKPLLSFARVTSSISDFTAYFKNCFLNYKCCCSSALLQAQAYIPCILLLLVLLLLFGGEAACSGTESCSHVLKVVVKRNKVSLVICSGRRRSSFSFIRERAFRCLLPETGVNIDLLIQW